MAAVPRGLARVQEVHGSCTCGGTVLVAWEPTGRVHPVGNALAADVQITSGLCAHCGTVFSDRPAQGGGG